MLVRNSSILARAAIIPDLLPPVALWTIGQLAD
jgi:hypothetical protein